VSKGITWHRTTIQERENAGIMKKNNKKKVNIDEELLGATSSLKGGKD